MPESGGGGGGGVSTLFGTQDNGKIGCQANTPKAWAQNSREVRIQPLREELKSLKRQYKVLVQGKVERAGLAELRAILSKELLILWRVESHRRRRKDRARRRATFLANPYQLTKQLLGQKRGDQLNCSRDEINNHIKCTLSVHTATLRRTNHWLYARHW